MRCTLSVPNDITDLLPSSFIIVSANHKILWYQIIWHNNIGHEDFNDLFHMSHSRQTQKISTQNFIHESANDVSLHLKLKQSLYICDRIRWHVKCLYLCEGKLVGISEHNSEFVEVGSESLYHSHGQDVSV